MKLAEAQNVPLSDLVVLKDWQQITQAVTPVKLIGYSTFLYLSESPAVSAYFGHSYEAL